MQKNDKANENRLEEIGGQMSFLDHLDELRKRLINCVIAVVIAFIACFYFSASIYNFLSAPVVEALAEANRSEFKVEGLTGNEKISPLNELKVGQTGRYVFNRATNLGTGVAAAGTSVLSRVEVDSNGKLGLFTAEPIFTGNVVIPSGIRLPFEFEGNSTEEKSADERMVVTTATEPFTLYVTVSFYSAIAFSIPFLLWQIWGFISPGLYRHEKKYVTPFIGLSTISFIIGAAFAYYILFPPAVRYLLWLGGDFTLMLRASDYLDFITLIMLAMGLIFQMPAITYVFARIGLVSAEFLIKSWKFAIVIILIIAALVSPTADIPNMMLFAAPMVILYIFSIGIAWFFGKKRTNGFDTGNLAELEEKRINPK